MTNVFYMSKKKTYDGYEEKKNGISIPMPMSEEAYCI